MVTEESFNSLYWIHACALTPGAGCLEEHFQFFVLDSYLNPEVTLTAVSRTPSFNSLYWIRVSVMMDDMCHSQRQ